MIRIGLCLYLVLVMLAGPALCCCCTTHHLTTRLLDRAGGQQPTDRPQSCCHHRNTPLQHQEPDQGCGKQERPTPPRCPCKERGSQPTPVLAVDAEVAQQLLLKQLLQVLNAFVPLLPSVALLSPMRGPGASDQANALPFLTAQDLLHSLHRLRC
jgi:hypothetical protein